MLLNKKWLRRDSNSSTWRLLAVYSPPRTLGVATWGQPPLPRPSPLPHTVGFVPDAVGVGNVRARLREHNIAPHKTKHYENAKILIPSETPFF